MTPCCTAPAVASDVPIAARGASKVRWLPLVILIFLAVNARWIWVYRHALALDIDEAGYLSFSLIDYYGLHYGGIPGWIAAIEMPNIQAPMTMALSSLVYAMVGPHVIAGFAVPLAAGAGCIAAAYLLARSLGSDRAGLAAAVLTATCPVMINFARSYQFSLLATLFTTLALVSIVRSRGFRSIVWTLAFGACLGLMPLARTMMLAFIPGLLAAALAVIWADRRDRRPRLVALAGAVTVGILVAAPWFWSNGWLVAQYLLNFGYGAHALEYGRQTSKLGFDAWISMAQAFNSEVYFPHFLIMLLGVLAMAGAVAGAAVKHGIAATATRIRNSGVLPVAIFAAEALVILTTTSNKGSGFFAPVVPAAMVLTAWSLWHIGEAWIIRTARWTVVAIVGTIATVPLLDLHTPFAPVRVAEVPLLGGVTVTDGRGTIQQYEAAGDYGSRNAVEPVDASASHAWLALSAWTAETLTEQSGQSAIVAFGFRNHLYNVNTVNLQQLLRVRSAFAARQIDPITTGESVAGYLGWLQREGTDACALLTSDRISGDFAPDINRTYMKEAAEQAGFIPMKNWTAPDGQIVSLWKHRVTPANCP